VVVNSVAVYCNAAAYCTLCVQNLKIKSSSSLFFYYLVGPYLLYFYSSAKVQHTTTLGQGVNVKRLTLTLILMK